MTVQAAPQTKSAYFSEVKTIDDEQGVFEGYLSMFGNVDRYKDVVEPGAFSKTINDARGRKSKYLFPLLWQHQATEPIGGFIDMKEDTRGLYVKAQIDLDTDLGKRAYSGLRMGYLDGLSIGYDTIKQRWEKDIRHLLEVRMWEGSVVTFPANDLTRVNAIKAACGSTDLPLGDRNEAWSGSKAHSQIVQWASNDDGSVDTNKLKTVHFYVDDTNPDKITSYKLPFCYIVDGAPVAVPKAIFAVAAILQGARGGGNFGGADEAIKARVSRYYTKMSKEFDDASIVPPWENEEDSEDKEEKHMPMTPPTKPSSARDFQSVLHDRAPQEIMDELYDLFGALMTATVEQVYGTDSVDTCQSAVKTSVSQFQEALSGWVAEAWKTGIGGSPDEDEGDEEYEEQKDYDFADCKNFSLAHFTVSVRALKWALKYYLREEKAGRAISTTNKKRIHAAVDAIHQATGDLKKLVSDPDEEEQDESENIEDQNEEEMEPEEETNPKKKPAKKSNPFERVLSLEDEEHIEEEERISQEFYAFLKSVR